MNSHLEPPGMFAAVAILQELNLWRRQIHCDAGCCLLLGKVGAVDCCELGMQAISMLEVQSVHREGTLRCTQYSARLQNHRLGIGVRPKAEEEVDLVRRALGGEEEQVRTFSSPSRGTQRWRTPDLWPRPSAWRRRIGRKRTSGPAHPPRGRPALDRGQEAFCQRTLRKSET